MVSNVTSTTDTTAAAAAMKKSMGMNKDDFLKLFVTQLQNQDPMNPTDSDKLLSQLSELSLVEQAYNSNTALQNLITAQNNTTNMTAMSFIGKDVKAVGNSISFDGTTSQNLQFNIPVPVDSAEILITDSAGRIVRTMTTSALTTGDSTYAWDGRDASGTLLPAGAYLFSVNGTTANGVRTPANTYTTGRINGVSLADGVPRLTIGPVSVALSNIVDVTGG